MMYKWTVECSIKEKIVLAEVFTDAEEKEAKDEFMALCFENKLSHEMPGPGMKLYDTIELYKQNTVTGEILERKVRSYK